MNAVTADARTTDGLLLLGSSPAMAQLRADIDTAARSDAKVLIAGETGVGKEIVARLIHDGGSRRRHNFLAINCAGMPDELLESELFGHVKGSFTGAYRDKPGLAAIADRGTLFLDELGEMSPRMQGVLLRFLETGEIHRVGADHIEQRVDVRVIAATNRNLLARIASGDFREDLYYRLNVIPVSIPPLRERGQDVLEIFTFYLAQYCRTHDRNVPELLPETIATLLAYRWPGNVRELKNIAERLAVRHAGDAIGPSDLPMEMRLSSGTTRPEPAVVAPTTPAPASARWVAADASWDLMIGERVDFWSAVQAKFMDRELTKTDVREIVRRGLKDTGGSYRRLIELFNLPATDYKRFLAFLAQHDCHLPFHPFREPK
jgi:transcriptional regulator with PAS, ATPase and Fis domain